jgi:hypothetical protein
MWYDDDPFLQLPYMNYELLKTLRKKFKNLPLEHYCMMTREQRQETGIYENPEQFEQVERAIAAFPLMDVEIKWEVEGEKEVAVGDILTITIKLNHKNLTEKENLGFVHSNKFPYLKQSSWYLIFTDAEEITFLAMEKLFIREKVFVKEIKERLSRPGVMQFFMILRNDSYRGFDKRICV